MARRLQPDRILGTLQSEVERLVAELDQSGDRNVSLIEARVAAMRELLTRVDAATRDARTLLVTLDDAIRDSRAASQAIADAAGSHESAGGGVAPADPPTEAPVAPADDGRAHDGTHHPEPVPQLAGADLVRHLRRVGADPDTIATRTGIAIGEVELIISLMEPRRRG